MKPNECFWLTLSCPSAQHTQQYRCRRPQFASRWRGNTIATSAILRIKSIEYYQFCIECNQTSVVDWPYQLPLLGACSDSIVTAACVIDEAKLLGIARSYNYLSLLGTISMYVWCGLSRHTLWMCVMASYFTWLFYVSTRLSDTYMTVCYVVLFHVIILYRDYIKVRSTYSCPFLSHLCM